MTHQRTGTRRGSRLLAGALAGVLAAGGALTVTAPTPASAAGHADACPSSSVPATPFTDTVGSVHRAGVDCLAWWGLTEGRTATRYGAEASVTRGQAAAMIARLIERTGHAPDTVDAAGFEDTDGHRFAAEIDLLAHLGVVTGRTETQFAPEAPVTRAQTASVLYRLLTDVYGVPLLPAEEPFDDVTDDNAHREAIGSLDAVGVLSGTSATTFAPGRAVDRGQTASLLTRSLTLLVDLGVAELPEERPAADDPYAAAVRGTWVHLFDDTLKSRSSIAAMVDELAAAEVNTVVVQVARRHDAYYDSQVLPATQDPELESGLDVLAELLPRAHAAGIDVHAWISVAPTWHKVYADIGVTPEELGADTAWRTRTIDGEASTYLDPALEPVREHVADVVGELAGSYDLDGIHLDYVRYASERHGYHPDALERFRAETGVTGTPEPRDRRWSDWRRSQTRKIISRARTAAAAADPDVELSAATISWLDGPTTPDRTGFQATRSYRDVFQDWDEWARRGRLDTVMPMNYFRAHDAAQATGLARWLDYEHELAREPGVRVVPGLAGYLNHPDALRAQVREAMRHGDGALVYSFQQPTLDHSRDVWDELAATRWGYPPTAP